MKRTYAKPVMTVERFLANVAVAACEPYKEAQPVTVTCLRGGQTHNIFYDACGDDNFNKLSNVQIVEYQGQKYFIWLEDPRYNTGTDNNNDLLNAVCEAGGIDNSNAYHGGAFNDEIETIVNHS